MSKKYTSEVTEELKALAPVLSGLPKANPLELPDGYFEDVEENIISQIQLTNYELKISVPPGYLEKVEDDLLSTIITTDSDKGYRVFSILKYRKKIATIAAIMLLILSAWFVFNRADSNSNEITINTEDQDAYLEYIHNNIGDYDINMLVDQGLIVEEDLVIDYPVFEQPDSEDTPWIDSDINF